MTVNNHPRNDLAIRRPAISRRGLIGRLAAAGFTAPIVASILRDSAWAQEATPTAEEALAALGKDPSLVRLGSTTFETPAALMDDFLTPNDQFFIRSNGPVSIDIPRDEWRLAVTGLVDRKLDLSFADLEAMEQRTITAFLACSGHSRGRFGDDPATVEGTKWGNGAIGNAEWTGVSLIDILDEAGVQSGAVDVVSQGGDFPEMQRGLPIELATDPDVMLVWMMNGEDLPAPNGGPVRLLVPGWGGIASTKWIVGLEVIDRPFAGPFNSESYVIVDELGAVVRPVREMPVSSVITTPLPDAEVAAGAVTIGGFAWSGYGGIERVEVSTDDGATWSEAPIVEEAGPLSWVRFEAAWEATGGPAVLQSRAVDQRGLTQPVETEWNAKGYLQNSIYRVPVTVA
ncbi:MAG TPA: sulfite oxidase [Thermomicrobiales bacterium]|nr:sulfite oxidase [Thermomicrobiales bacterium]